MRKPAVVARKGVVSATAGGKVGKKDSAHDKKTERRETKAAAQIATQLRRQIVTGALNVGEKLVSERVLQERFQVSRPTLREAMRLLEAESLIKISRGQHGGARVQKLDVSVTARQVGMYLQMEGATVADVLQARTFLEPPAAGLVAERRSLSVIEELRTAVAAATQAYESHDARKFGECTAHFSESLIAHAGNKTLALFARLLHNIVSGQMVDVAVRTSSEAGVFKKQLFHIRERERLIGLIARGEVVEAERFWRQYLETTSRAILSAYRAQMPIDVLQQEGGASSSDR